LIPCHPYRFFGRNRGNFVPHRSLGRRRLGPLRHWVCCVPAVGVGGAVSCKPWEALRAHWVWHCSCVFVQFMVHDVLWLTLAPGDCAAISGGVVEPSATAAGSRRSGRSPPELHVIMQAVVVEDCTPAAPANAATAITPSMIPPAQRRFALSVAIAPIL